MEHEYWHKKWSSGDIAFHQPAPNPLLVAHFDRLSAPKGAQIFVPLCGKTTDIGWLLSQGYRVVGAELSELAVTELFQNLGLTPNVVEKSGLKLFSHDRISIYVGDIFKLTAGLLGRIDLIYDRAALVALPEPLRLKYAAHLMEITRTAPQFLICFDYDQSTMNGPPFSINDAAVESYYAAQYNLTSVARETVKGGLKGKTDASENVWLLTPR